MTLLVHELVEKRAANRASNPLLHSHLQVSHLRIKTKSGIINLITNRITKNSLDTRKFSSNTRNQSSCPICAAAAAHLRECCPTHTGGSEEARAKCRWQMEWSESFSQSGEISHSVNKWVLETQSSQGPLRSWRALHQSVFFQLKRNMKLSLLQLSFNLSRNIIFTFVCHASLVLDCPRLS